MTIAANIIELLQQLKDLGYPPLLGVMLAFVIILSGAIFGVCVFFWRENGKAWAKRDEERKARDEERATWHRQVENRLNDCESDREDLRVKVDALDDEVKRIRRCPRANCPMRLPK